MTDEPYPVGSKVYACIHFPYTNGSMWNLPCIVLNYKHVIVPGQYLYTVTMLDGKVFALGSRSLSRTKVFVNEQ